MHLEVLQKRLFEMIGRSAAGSEVAAQNSSRNPSLGTKFQPQKLSKNE